MKNPLERELRIFAKHKPEWIEEHQGKFVLIKDDKVLGFFDTELEAVNCGFQKCGYDVPILVKQIIFAEPVIHIKGANIPCLTSL